MLDFTYCLDRAWRSTSGKCFGHSHVAPGHVHSRGTAHSPTHAGGSVISQKYIRGFPSPHERFIPQHFLFIVLASLFFGPAVIIASGSCDDKQLPLIIFYNTLRKRMFTLWEVWVRSSNNKFCQWDFLENAELHFGGTPATFHSFQKLLGWWFLLCGLLVFKVTTELRKRSQGLKHVITLQNSLFLLRLSQVLNKDSPNRCKSLVNFQSFKEVVFNYFCQYSHWFYVGEDFWTVLTIPALSVFLKLM